MSVNLENYVLTHILNKNLIIKLYINLNTTEEDHIFYTESLHGKHVLYEIQSQPVHLQLVQELPILLQFLFVI